MLPPDSSLPRPEYPRPQFVRDSWQCLNGPWNFEIDSADTGLDRGLLDRPLSSQILVPFCPESSLSGVGQTDFMAAVWYRRRITIPEDWDGARILLHFQAVDYDATVWADKKEIKRHRGGFTPFTADLGPRKGGDVVEITLRARDPHEPPQPRGKQSWKFHNFGCLYTRTTGIWQTVWMEPVGESHLLRTRITPDLTSSCFHIEQPIRGPQTALSLRASLLLPDGTNLTCTCVSCTEAMTPRLRLDIPSAHRRLWSPEDPFLYGLLLELLDAEGQVLDSVRSYAGLRAVTLDGKAVKLNGRPVFQRLVLDQGYYPDGLMTAPTDEALVADIQLSLDAGFNGARLHQKVFEERFLYHADRMGYLVWGEFGDWGCGGAGHPTDHQKPGPSYIGEWIEAVQRDYSHPSIIGWCPLNETFQPLSDRISQLDDVTHAMYWATKAIDPTRPVIDASGYAHRVPETDIYDSHDYEQDPAAFARIHAGLAEGRPFINPHPHHHQAVWSVPYQGQPFFVSEFGGIWWNPDAKPGEDSWGYGQRPQSLEEFYTRFEGLCQVLLSDPHMFGYCYTQLTDVFQEQNGLYRFDRSLKFDLKRIKAVQTQIAAIEKSALESRNTITAEHSRIADKSRSG
ncbi:MAG: glycoside hydrolase family 2 TIM barrel-domain containing protein [Candidatus Methylacidiphilales bacterium]|nr:glycoside hydrolase family 2 TIM barrel-domain containing protein [Candidatus Methylacidiphilales bacterium]